MRESIHKYFQVGTIRWMSFPNRSVVDQVKRIAVDDYFDTIEERKPQSTCPCRIHSRISL